MKRLGLTLVETLVVIGILFLLGALVGAATRQALRSANVS
jgi:type II secretory pathway pseudopilin PulG